MIRQLFRKQINSRLDLEFEKLAEVQNTKKQKRSTGLLGLCKNDLQRPNFTCFETWCVHETSLCA